MIFNRKILVAGIALLALAGAQSLRADFRSDVLDAFGVKTIEAAKPLIEEAKIAGRPEGWYFSGRFAILNFDFDKARKELTEFQRLAKANGFLRYIKDSEDALQGLKEAEQQFERFQDIIVIDAIDVDRTKFFRRLHLPLSAGRYASPTEIPGDAGDRGEAGYISEGGDLMLWSQWLPVEPTESDGNSVSVSEEDNDEEADNGADYIVEATLLADGSLSVPKKIENLGDYPDYPFLTADGVTLYYSAYGDNSVGERDIFITSRDPMTGEFRAPVNAGFPFNSGADDYLLAIDEENGVGWWATDRHLLGDKIRLYVFLLPEGRKNFGGSAEEKRERGILDDVAVTWSGPAALAYSPMQEVEAADEETEKSEEQLAEEQANREEKFRLTASEIRKIRPGQVPHNDDCKIPISGGGYIYSPDDVESSLAKRLVEQYIKARKAFDAEAELLDKARRSYADAPSESLGKEILSKEKSVEADRLLLINILSDLYKELGNK